MADFWADKYWNGKYFNVRYFGSSDADPNAMSGSAAGTSTAAGELTFVNHNLAAIGGSWLPIIYIKNKKKRPEIVEAVEEAVEVAVAAKPAERPAITAVERKEIARQIMRNYQSAGLRLGELENLISAIETRVAEEARRQRNNRALAILLMAA